MENVLRRSNPFNSENVLFIAFSRIKGFINVFSLRKLLVPVPFVNLAFRKAQNLC